MHAILYFAAVQYIRVPSFRPKLLNIRNSVHRSFFSDALKTEASWESTLVKADIPLDSRGADYKSALKYQQEVLQKRPYYLSAENGFYLMKGLKSVDNVIFPALKRRHWTTLYSPSGSFIGSDTPVVMDGRKDRKIGFKSADVIIFTINRYLAIYGTNEKIRQPFVNRKFIANHNTFTLLNTDEQVYSHSRDFCWMDLDGKVQTDWKLFSKAGFVDSIRDAPNVLL